MDEAGVGPLAGPVLAAAVAFLASPRAAAITGEDLNVSAGLVMYCAERSPPDDLGAAVATPR